MQIRHYDEVDPFEVYELTMASFGFPVWPREVHHMLKRDPWVLPGFAVYAVEGGKPVAQVVPLKTYVCLTTGVEPVGAIAGVCSLPEVWGKGYVRRLMEHVQDVYRELGLGMTTLMTSRNIRGYGIYQKLAYLDLAPFHRAARRLPLGRRKPAGMRLRRAMRRDLPRIQSLFEAYTRGLCGWVVRDPRTLEARVTRNRKILKEYRMAIRDGQVVGYARARPWHSDLADEVIVPKSADFRDAIHTLEASQRKEFATVLVTTSQRDGERYRRLGYEVYSAVPSTTMAMPLDGIRRTKDLPELFGIPQGRFVHYGTEWF